MEIAVEHPLSVIPILLMACWVLLSVGLIAFWIEILIDCISNEPSTGNDKLIWVLVIVLGGWVGAIVYRIVYRQPQRKAQHGR